MAKKNAKLSDKLYKAMCSRIPPRTEMVPESWGQFDYYQRMDPGENFAKFCRVARKGFLGLSGREQVMLDQNKIKGYSHLGPLKISPDHSHLAYTIDNEGREVYSARFKDLGTGKELPDVLKNVYAVEWCADGRSVIYTEFDHLHRPSKVYYHRLGTPQSADRLLYEDKDDRFFVDVGVTKDRKWLTISSTSKTTSDVRVLSADHPLASPLLIAPRVAGTEYFVEHHEGYFIIVTNVGNTQPYMVVRAPVDKPDPTNWQCIIPPPPSGHITDVDVFARHLVSYEKHFGVPRVRVYEFQTGESHYVPLDDRLGHENGAFALEAGGNRDFDAEVLRFLTSSMLEPGNTWDYNMRSRTLLNRERIPIAGGDADFFWESCELRRLSVRSSDGVDVPLTLLHKRGLALNGRNPCLLHCYGGYGISAPIDFCASRLHLLAAGWVLAVAHPRGGGELGRAWHEAGRLMRKRNSMRDVVDTAEYLVREGYTSQELLAGSADSGGGVVLGCIANEHPDLFRAMVLNVPFVDVLGTMSDPTLPLTKHEYDEWGDPSADPAVRDYIASYSPYQNVRRQRYPSMLVTASLIDDRVPFWIPLKWVARLRAMAVNLTPTGSDQTDARQIVMRISKDTGHFGEGGRYAQFKQRAEEHAFLSSALKVPVV